MNASMLLPWELRPRTPEPRHVKPAHGLPFWQERAGEIVIAGTLFDVNARELFDLLNGGGEPPAHVLFRIVPGAVLQGVYSAAVNIGDWPSGITLEAENRGRIQGAGGDAGKGGSTSSGEYDGGDGSRGGIALYTRYAISITNDGEIWSGGGGAGGGGAELSTYPGAGPGGSTLVVALGGGGGGGGGGRLIGNGGSGGNGGADDGSPGEDGTNTAGGDGGSGGSTSGDSAGAGGDGGNPGFGGGAGGDGAGNDTSGSGGSGGATGDAVDGDSFVTYDTEGDIRGDRVN